MEAFVENGSNGESAKEEVLTVILTGRTAFHSAQGGLSSAESYVAGISDDFLFVTFCYSNGHYGFLDGNPNISQSVFKNPIEGTDLIFQRFFRSSYDTSVSIYCCSRGIFCSFRSFSIAFITGSA